MLVTLDCHLFCPAGAQLLWGGQPLQGHSIPDCYGAIQPTAVFVPLKAMRDPEAFKLVTTEVFGPFQVITEYTGEALDQCSQELCCCIP
jgi:1-pyrroline-5-carboxylate dehydrogenase